MLRKSGLLVRYLQALPRCYSSQYEGTKYNKVERMGERLFEEPKPELTPVEVSKEEWQYVEDILPREVMPEPPKHESYPTPSGWFPPTASPDNSSYFVRRTRYHNYPVYLETFSGGNRKMTELCKIEGDIWQLETDLRKYLKEKTGKKVLTQVDEVCTKIRFRGIHLENVAEFLKERGF